MWVAVGVGRTFVQLLETFELWSETTLGGSVDNEHDLALEVGQRVLVALLVLWLEVVESGSGRHACEPGLWLVEVQSRDWARGRSSDMSRYCC